MLGQRRKIQGWVRLDLGKFPDIAQTAGKTCREGGLGDGDQVKINHVL